MVMMFLKLKIVHVKYQNCIFYLFYIPCPLNPCECSKNQKTTHSRVIFKNLKIEQQLTNPNTRGVCGLDVKCKK